MIPVKHSTLSIVAKGSPTVLRNNEDEEERSLIDKWSTS